VERPQAVGIEFASLMGRQKPGTLSTLWYSVRVVKPAYTVATLPWLARGFAPSIPTQEAPPPETLRAVGKGMW